MVGAEVEFLFSDEWESLIRTAVFIAGSEKRVVLEAAWRDNICTVPHECLAEPDFHLLVGVYGTNAAGNLVIPTVYADLGMIWAGADPDGESGAEASPELWAQLQAQLYLKESSENKVTSISEASTDGQYPSAKAVYEALTAGAGVVIEGTVSDDMSTVTITTPDAWTTVYEAWNSEKPPLVVLRLSNLFYAYLTCVVDADYAVFSIPAIYMLEGAPSKNIFLCNTNNAFIRDTMDSAMDGESINAVQNKVIKKYVDDKTAAQHSHDNKSVLDGITSEKIAEWDSASGSSGGAGGGTSDSTGSIITLYGTWNADNNLVSFNGIPSGSTAYGIIHDALIAGKLPMLCITNSDGDWEAFFHLCRSDRTEYQFSSFETDSSGGPLLGIVWVRADSAGYQCTVP